jgi:DNA topoisomerase-6 subunit A
MTEKRKTKEEILKILKEIPKELYNQLEGSEIPKINITSRTMNNLLLEDDYWIYGQKETVKTCETKGGISQLIKIVYSLEFLLDILQKGYTSTLREMYYCSESWGLAKFKTQQESNYLIENLEIYTKLAREQFGIRPEEKGCLIGPIVLEEEFKGRIKRINCIEDVTSGYYTIPYNINNIKIISNTSKFVMAIETGGMFERLVECKFHEKYHCTLVDLKGQPSRSTREIIRLLSEKRNLPVLIFTDGDPWSYRIFASIAYGAVKSAHLTKKMVSRNAYFIGIKPSDIVEYDLNADELNKRDILALQQELKDRRFINIPEWEKEIELQLKLKKKSEQQALAKYGLSFVVDEYLPRKLKVLGITEHNPL